MKTKLLVFLWLGLSMQVWAQSNTVVDTSFYVAGVCGMCEERIENALSVKGIKHAHWDSKTQMLHVVYKPQKITEDEIHTLLWNVGHDTYKGKAPAESYQLVHGCCRYREMEPHE